jgi:hypothetical protein
MRYRKGIFVLIVGIAIGLAIPLAAPLHPTTSSAPKAAQTVPKAPTAMMCDNGTGVPSDWIQTSEDYDALHCTSADGALGRVMNITRYEQLGTLDVCSDAKVPEGWVVTSFYAANRCHQNHTMPAHDAMTIKRLYEEMRETSR